MKPNDPANLELNHLAPTVVADGHIVFIAGGNNVPTLTFFQIRKQDGSKVSADAVASVRMGSLEDLENLKKAITETIEQHNKKEP
ncbi:hypothetical protein A3E49_00010 [Candidatus Saccharibacteria bacterium RIFCSPHIGHO2_12_FULL_49_19]|nr:MAG: hypothetical protein A2708_01920 [Candidatus Saccharibacteria bacterium RIFCSPHIGHO2_01_FULL_49_21]OGL37671.1 MAG: hypothetical protein A3E49_00010 [Candidatus Saccharibacteria bacterium RIFCSPHIGHO2_12_FULL_49_19]OGL37871.1 MAG: hypothetical protein A3B63_00470 [Candidatus Saccharibacteria bacterium RIFCSPLOWO2_01_FULL_49_22]